MIESNGRGDCRLAIRRKQFDLVRALERENRCLLHRNRELQKTNRQLRRRTQQMRFLAMTDSLTGLFNRRAIEEAVAKEIGRRNRYPGPLALGLIDADHFKKINRRYLHPGGDQALIGLAKALRGSLRATDRVGRVGGEEFLVLSPHTDLAGAKTLAERLRTTVAQIPILYNGQTIAVTVSIGFAVANLGTPADFNVLKQIAAEALAEAKTAGRNCSIIRTLSATE